MRALPLFFSLLLVAAAFSVGSAFVTPTWRLSAAFMAPQVSLLARCCPRAARVHVGVGGGGLRGLAAQVQASESRERDQDSLPSATKLLVEEQDKLQAPQEGELLSERVRSAVQTIKRRKLMFQQVSL